MRHYIKTIAKNGLPILWAYFAWMKRYGKHPDRYPLELRYRKLRKLVRSVILDLNVEFHVEGLENIPDEPYYLVSNHISFLDPLTYMCVLEKPISFVAKKESEKMPFVGLCVKILNGLFINREDIKESLKTMMTLAENLTKKTCNWSIFPEGTRNSDHMSLCSEFHHGSFRGAARTNTPILPVAIHGTNRVLKTKPEYKKFPVFIKFLPPVMPEVYDNMNTKDIAKMAQNSIQKAISFDLRIKDHQYMSSHYKKKYRFNSAD